MNSTPLADRFPLIPGIVLDARRAAWFPESKTLAVADLHLGRAWSERRRGNLLPIEAPDDSPVRLARLQADYQPRTVVILGDLLHEAVAVADVEASLRDLLKTLAATARVILTRGNHDRELSRARDRWPLEIVDHCAIGPHLGIHGDEVSPRLLEQMEREGEGERWLVMGHEHPCTTLGDGVGSSVKCPCFVVGDRRLILPAFSTWAAGCEVGRRPFISAVARGHAWRRLVAIVGSRCLELPFP